MEGGVVAVRGKRMLRATGVVGLSRARRGMGGGALVGVVGEEENGEEGEFS